MESVAYSRRLLVSLVLIVAITVGSGLDKVILQPFIGSQVASSLSIPPAMASSTVLPFGQDTLVASSAPYLSSVESVSEYTAIQATWEQSANSDVSLWASNGDEWLEMVNDPDAGLGISSPALLAPSSQLQLKVLVKAGDIHDIQVHLLDPGIQDNSFIPQASADETVITRSQWGADESLRLRETRDRLRAEAAKKTPAPKPTSVKPTTTPTPTGSPTENKSDADEYGANCNLLQAKYPEEFKIGQVISTDVAGKAFTWPIAYTMKLRKIVVHHTDMEIKDYDQSGVIDESDYKAAVRSIYYFHTISRDWGDIGYNYLIDPAGNIYEGRAGGDMAIAAHTLCKNNGSLGVALLGNFQNETPTTAALQAVQSLIKAKSQAYNIDTQGMGLFYGDLLPNIIGHRNVRATSCPGDQLYNLLPALRSGDAAAVQNITFPVFDTSIYRKASAPNVPVIPETQKVYRSQAQSVTASVVAEAGRTAKPTLTFQNLGTTIWNQDTVIRPVYLERGASMLKQAKQQQDFVSPNGFATFMPELVFDSKLAGRAFVIEFYVVVNDQVELNTEKAKLNVQVLDQTKSDVTLNGVPLDQLKTTLSQNVIATQLLKSSDHVTQFLSEEIGGPTAVNSSTTAKNIRIKLGAPDTSATAEASSNSNVVVDNRTVAVLLKGSSMIVIPQSKGLLVKIGKNTYEGAVVRLVPQDEEEGKVTLVNFLNVPEWNKTLNDNVYRNVIEWRILSGKLVTINELPVELYLRGLAEVSNTAHPEKQKTMAIIARSYAQYYLTRDQKFPGMPYQLDDDPNSSQKYLGYGYEKRSPNFVAAVNATKNQVVTYDGEVVKTPYFNKSDGRTRSAQEVWGWTNTPYLVSVADPLCQSEEKKLSGHGVGLSGCGADGAAARGYTAEQILHYYYPGTIISTL
jgi:peptidoglycan hydrolase-like amidase